MSKVLNARSVMLAVLGFSVLTGSAASAADNETQKLLENVAKQQKVIEELKQTLAAQQAQLDSQRAQLEGLSRLSTDEMAKASGAGPAPQGKKATPTSTTTPVATVTSSTPPTAPRKEKEEIEARPQIDALPDAGGVLTPKGTLVYENSLEYTNTSNNVFSFNGVQVAQSVLVGVLNARSDRQQTVMDSSRFRLGLTNRLEADVRIPFVHSLSTSSSTDTSTNVTTRSSVDGTGIGDIDAGIAYQFNSGRDNWPFFVGNLRYKANNGDGPYDVPVDADNLITRMPTGTGFNAVQASVSAIKVSDPAILYANLGYIYNLPESVDRNFNDTRIGDVEGGDNINASAGMALSLNPDLSFTMGYKHSYVFPVFQDSTNLTTGNSSRSRTDTLQVGSMLFGVSYKLSPITSVNFTSEVGVTKDAPDVHIGVRVPIRLGQVF